ncbi:MAG: prepilin peptidase [Chthoniobacterales bacterium]|nr:prepilin peptidase [Chthoniobacterales bacterium]
MGKLAAYELVFRTFAFVLGAAIGSFLNVCIYRLPLDLSVNEPRRSFCPSCRRSIPWQQNIPLLSWLFLRGRCANCGSKIAFRYFAVELLTALLFLAVWLCFPWKIALVYWLLVALLIVATFIDFAHFIIPDEVTIGGTIAGVLASLAVPALMVQESRLLGFAWSLGAAALGYALLWLVLEGGKKVFGKKRIRLPAAAPFSWVREGDDAQFVVGEERGLWSDYFARESDQMLLHCDEAALDARRFENVTLDLHYNRLTIGEESFPLDSVDRISGVVRELQIPREAMGRGDLKFLAAIGAFLGWRAVLFSVFTGSLAGSLVGLTSMAMGRRAWSAKIPFGPYLALGALVWMFFGSRLLGWYLNLLAQ